MTQPVVQQAINAHHFIGAPMIKSVTLEMNLVDVQFGVGDHVTLQHDARRAPVKMKAVKIANSKINPTRALVDLEIDASDP